MKGKLYKSKPLSPKNEVLDFFLKKSKPWEEKTEKIYTWKSSIPNKWINLKGEEFFKHISEVSTPKLSIEILQNTKKYMHQLRIHSQESIRRSSPKHNEEKPRESPTHTFRRRFSLPSNQNSPDKTLLVEGESTPHIITQQSRTFTAKDNRSTFNSLANNGQIDDFLKRFDKKPSTREHPLVNRGLLGWKLKQLRANKNKVKKNNYCQIFNVKKITDNVFESGSTKRLHSVG
ncbi:hypothetical protein SteCoe_11674 [Stentor coeruleus]|uniref:Uncharacterized protein n=1 Tax=Stentor coeruleus TaxID=5963 RepID=A0A1R2CCJ9_9CILI|nr:hypothetical protein SteCoe_11674 [Stentor coeruleus]